MTRSTQTSSRFRSFRQTLFLVPFLFLPYRWLWLPCAIGAWRLAGANRLNLRDTMARDGSLIVGSLIVLLIREAFDYAFWLPWMGGVALLCGLRGWAKWSPWMGHVLRPIGLIVAVAFLLRPGTRPNREFAEPLARHDTCIVCAGDSLTSGVKVGDDLGTYVARLRERSRGTVINAGVANDRTADLLARLDRTVLAHQPQVVLLFIGGNDYLDGTPRRDFAASLEKIASRVASTGAKMVIVEVPTGIVWNPYAGVYRNVARKHGAILVPETRLRLWYSVELLLRDRLPDPLTIDGIHLSPTGATRVAQWLEPYLVLAHRRATL
jgi:lysophospholipase L1-like esterase